MKMNDFKFGFSPVYVKALSKLMAKNDVRHYLKGFNIKPHPKGGVILSDKTVEESQIATNVGLAMTVGPDAYNDKDRFPNGAWCKKKDWVIFARYAGSRLNIEGGELRLLNDDEILGVIDDPESILSPVTH